MRANYLVKFSKQSLEKERKESGRKKERREGGGEGEYNLSTL